MRGVGGLRRYMIILNINEFCLKKTKLVRAVIAKTNEEGITWPYHWVVLNHMHTFQKQYRHAKGGVATRDP